MIFCRVLSDNSPVFICECIDTLSLQVIVRVTIVVSTESHSGSRVYTRDCDVQTHTPVSTVSLDYCT